MQDDHVLSACCCSAECGSPCLSANEGNNDDTHLTSCSESAEHPHTDNKIVGHGENPEAHRETGGQVPAPTSISSRTSHHQDFLPSAPRTKMGAAKGRRTMDSYHAEMNRPCSRSSGSSIERSKARRPMACINGCTAAMTKSKFATKKGICRDNGIVFREADEGAVKPKGSSVSKCDSLMPVGMSKTQLGGIKDLCKNCKSGKSESVCFISNDGRVAAANTGPPTVCHFHLCNSTRCTASPNYKPPTSLPSQKVLQAKARALRSLNDEKVRAQIYATDEMGSSAVKSFFGKGKAVPPDENSDYRKELGDTNVQEAISAIHEHSVEENACTKSGTTSYEVGRPEECPLDDCQNEKGVPAGCMPPLDHAIDDKCCLRFVDCRDMPSRENASKDIVTKDSTHLNSIEAPQSGKICMERMRRKYLDCLRAQEAETVRLRKHEMIERRQAGEWMLDNAIGEILQRLAPDGEAGVRVMVEAFESIMHQGG